MQADLKTMLACGVFGMSAITALTAQNTTGVRSIQDTKPDILADQINMVFEDIPYLALGDTLPKAIKHAKKYLTGALKAQLDLGHGPGPMDHFWKYR